MEAAEGAKEKLTRAFLFLRKEGFVARQRFSCCRGCAGSALTNEQQEKQAAGKKLPKSYVYYTKQDGFLDGNRVRKLYLSFGDFTKKGQGEPTDTSGYTIVKALKEAGLAFEWDGNPMTCIVVDPCPGLWD